MVFGPAAHTIGKIGRGQDNRPFAAWIFFGGGQSSTGAAACIITDYWKGVEEFFLPGKEILVVKNGDEVEQQLKELISENVAEIGKAAYKKALERHTYTNCAKLFEQVISQKRNNRMLIVIII